MSFEFTDSAHKPHLSETSDVVLSSMRCGYPVYP
jgi:hypothetical protein